MGWDAASKTAATVAAGVAGAVFFAWPLSIWALTRKLDQPKYQIVKALTKEKSWLHSGYVSEVRRYSSYIIAEVEIAGGDIQSALGSGFRQVGGYIFGGNTKAGMEPEKVAMTAPVGLDVKPGVNSEKVPMTAPVGADLLEGNTYKVWFMMPHKYERIEQLPTPTNPRVTFKEVPARTLAALTFSGPGPREEVVEDKRQQLEALVRGQGLTPKGHVHLWQYHPPFCPPWQRRNEVLLEVEEQ